MTCSRLCNIESRITRDTEVTEQQENDGATNRIPIERTVGGVYLKILKEAFLIDQSTGLLIFDNIYSSVEGLAEVIKQCETSVEGRRNYEIRRQIVEYARTTKKEELEIKKERLKEEVSDGRK